MNYQPTHFELPADDTWHDPEGKRPPYLFTEEIAIAVDVALVTQRPLLVAGPPGSGKSTLAAAMAGLLQTRLLKHVFTSRSRLEELTADFDHLRRLRDANSRGDQPLPRNWAYLEPGLLWWAFDAETARRRGASTDDHGRLPADYELPEPQSPLAADFTGGNTDPKCSAVLLLDEIDKAEPDLPNDLLEPLDLKRFQIPDRAEDIIAPEGARMLTLITTNGERELPPAFLRRCVSLVLKQPDKQRLTEIGRHHFPKNAAKPVADQLLDRIAEKLLESRTKARAINLRPPGASEYLDAVRACHELGKGPDDPIWPHIEAATLLKNPEWSEDGDNGEG